MFKNTASQKVTLLAIDTAANVPKTGDAANITAYVSKDDGTVTVLTDTSATELDATNAPGLYSFDLSQAETNGDKLLFSAKSSTSGIKIVPQLIYTHPTGGIASPTNITAGTIATVTNGVTISGTLTTLDAIWTKIKKWLQLMIRNDANVSSGNATELNEINALTGGGFGNFDPVGQSLQAAHVHLEDIEQDTAQIGVAGAGLLDIPDPLVTNSGTAQAGASGTITLATSASTTADFYKDQAIVLTGGTGAGQTNRITAYSTGRVATVQTTWATTPDNTTTYKVLGRVE